MLVGKLVDHYVIVRDYMSVVGTSGHTVYHPLESTSACADSHHCKGIAGEHPYCSTEVADSHADSHRLPRRLEQQAGHHALLARVMECSCMLVQ